MMVCLRQELKRMDLLQNTDILSFESVGATIRRPRAANGRPYVRRM